MPAAIALLPQLGNLVDSKRREWDGAAVTQGDVLARLRQDAPDDRALPAGPAPQVQQLIDVLGCGRGQQRPRCNHAQRIEAEDGT